MSAVIEMSIFVLLLVIPNFLCDAANIDRNNVTDFVTHKSRTDIQSNQAINCPWLLKALGATIDSINFLLDPTVIGNLIFPSNSPAPSVQFFLSTRRQPDPIDFGSYFDLRCTDFNIARKTIIIVHGFQSDASNDWVIDMKNAFLKWNDVNVLMVNWSDMSNTLDYTKAAINTIFVAQEILKFLLRCMTFANGHTKKWDDIHMIGHSLGAHICAITARSFGKDSRWKISRISGLDPAQPCFTDTNIGLKKTDANFIDVIHTNIKPFSEFGLGLEPAIGHVDFYPNGGKLQPGCLMSEGEINDNFDMASSRRDDIMMNIGKEFAKIGMSIIKNNNAELDIQKEMEDNYIINHSSNELKANNVIGSVCNHGRAYLYFTESIYAEINKNCTFWAHQWDGTSEGIIHASYHKCNINTCAKMGILANESSARGILYLETRNLAPYWKPLRSDPIPGEQLRRPGEKAHNEKTMNIRITSNRVSDYKGVYSQQLYSKKKI